MMCGLAVLLTMTLCPQIAPAGNLLKTIAYSASPNAYFNERAAEIARIYDGFFFVIGTWEGGIAANLEITSDAAPTTDWRQRVHDLIDSSGARSSVGLACGILLFRQGRNTPCRRCLSDLRRMGNSAHLHLHSLSRSDV